MELSHEMAGFLISGAGLLFILAAWPIPRHVQRWHVGTFDRIEPFMLGWLMRAIGLAMFMLGLMTLFSLVE